VLTIQQSEFDLMAWLAHGHGAEDTRPHVDAVIAALKVDGISTFGATGYCFGGKYALDLATENVTKAVVLNHPSFLQIPADFEVSLRRLASSS
jgi:dienelactone hydrolase